MSAPRTTPYVYDGPFAAVAVPLPSGRTIHVTRGETVDVLEHEAAALDAAEGFAKKPPPSKEASK